MGFQAGPEVPVTSGKHRLRAVTRGADLLAPPFSGREWWAFLRGFFRGHCRPLLALAAMEAACHEAGSEAGSALTNDNSPVSKMATIHGILLRVVSHRHAQQQQHRVRQVRGGHFHAIMSSPLDYATGGSRGLLCVTDEDEDDENREAALVEGRELTTLAVFETIMRRLNALEEGIKQLDEAHDASARGGGWAGAAAGPARALSRGFSWMLGASPSQAGERSASGSGTSTLSESDGAPHPLREEVSRVKRSVLALVSATSGRYTSKQLAYVAPGWGVNVLRPVSSPASALKRPAPVALQALRSLHRASAPKPSTTSKDLGSRRLSETRSECVIGTPRGSELGDDDGTASEGDAGGKESIEERNGWAGDVVPRQLGVLSSEELLSEDFSAFAVADRVRGEPVTCTLLPLLQNFGLLRMLPIDPFVLARFARAIDRGMSADNAYHNGEHAAEVTQRMALYLSQSTELLRSLTATELFAALVAAAIHDFEHLGVNNNFLVSIGSTYAAAHNDVACQENHSLVAAFEVMDAMPGCDIRGGLNAAERAAFRRVIIQMVQATDMSRHFDLVARFRARRQQGGGLSMSKADDRLLLLMMLIKAADISNSVKPWDQQREWAERVQAEFYAQGDMERELGLTLSPLMDRQCGDVPAGQVGFLEALAKPLFVALADELPALQPLVARLEANHERWKSNPEHKVWSSMRHQARLLHEVRSYRRKCVELSLWELSGEHSRPHVNNALASSSAGTEGVALPLMPARKVAVAGGSSGGGSASSKGKSPRRRRGLTGRVSSVVGSLLSPFRRASSSPLGRTRD